MSQLFRVGPQHLEAMLWPSDQNRKLRRAFEHAVCAIARSHLLEESLLEDGDDVVLVKSFELFLRGYNKRLEHGGGRFCGGCRLVRKSDMASYQERIGSVPWVVVKIRDDSGVPAVKTISPRQA